MQAVWILLGKTRYPAEFLQSSPGVLPAKLHECRALLR
jgi:hypothetical protein